VNLSNGRASNFPPAPIARSIVRSTSSTWVSRCMAYNGVNSCAKSHRLPQHWQIAPLLAFSPFASLRLQAPPLAHFANLTDHLSFCNALPDHRGMRSGHCCSARAASRWHPRGTAAHMLSIADGLEQRYRTIGPINLVTSRQESSVRFSSVSLGQSSFHVWRLCGL